MSRIVRTLVAVLVSVASVAVGVVAARALQDDGDDTAEAIGTAGGDPVVIVSGDVDIDAAAIEALPVLAPVVVGDDPSILDTLLEGPTQPAGDDDEPGPEVVGPGVGSGVAAPAGDDGVGSSDAPDTTAVTSDTLGAPEDDTDPWGGEPVVYFDPVTFDLFDLPLRVFDLCAGATPGSGTPRGCPSGYAATLFDAPLPPDPFLFGAVGHPVGRVTGAYSACSTNPTPGAGQTAVTVWSVTPLTTFTIEWRPYGTTRAWQQRVVEPATAPAVVDAWTDRLAGEPYDRAAWGMIPHCLLITRDPDRNVSGRVTATDIYGRVIEGNGEFLLPDATPDQRPPTTARIVGVQPMATVTGWTVSGGSVQFRVKAVTDATDSACDGDIVPDEQVHEGTGLATPVGAWRPEYDRWWTTNVLLPPGGMVVVCATVYDSDNTLRPAGTDTLLLHAPTAQRPRIVLEGIRLNSGVTIESARLGIQLALPDDPSPWDDLCARPWSNTGFGLTSGGSVTSQVLWECDAAPLPVDGEGFVKVPVQVVRVLPTGTTHETRREWIGVPITVDTCTDVCPPRPSEWFEVPIPSTGGGPDGVAIVRLDYALAEGPARTSTESVTMIDSTDRPLAEPTDGEPGVRLGETTTSEQDGMIEASVRVLADRPITLTSARFIDAIGGSPECREHIATIDPTTAATEFDIAGIVCFGMVYRVDLQYTDAAGVAYTRQLFGLYTPDVLSGSVDTSVEFHGASNGATLGWIYQFEVTLDGQDSSAYGMYLWETPVSGSRPSCMAMDGTTANSRTDPRIQVSGGALDVHVRINITTTGETDCSGRASSGLGVIELNGSFPIADLLNGEPVVLTTGPDSPLQMTVTVSGRWFARSG